MPEIPQSAPIKPVWPAKPDGGRERRQQPPLPERRDQSPQPQREEGPSGEDSPGIDEYA